MKKMVLAAVLAAIAGTASAQGYVGAVTGLTSYGVDCAGTTRCDKNDTGYKVYGGYQIDPNWGVEVGYTDFGKTSATVGALDLQVKAKAVSLVGVLRGQFSTDWSGVVRLGIASVKSTLSAAGLGSNSESNVKAYAGIGVEYALTKDFKITASGDFTDIEVEDQTGGVKMLSLGLQYGF